MAHARGRAWTVNQLNALMKSPLVEHGLAVFLTWDDFGGFATMLLRPAADYISLWTARADAGDLAGMHVPTRSASYGI